MNPFIQALDGSMLRVGGFDRLYIGSGFVSKSAGGDGDTLHDKIFADRHCISVVPPGEDAQKLLERLTLAVSESESGVFAIRDGAVVRL